jgi:hypothetical protein
LKNSNRTAAARHDASPPSPSPERPKLSRRPSLIDESAANSIVRSGPTLAELTVFLFRSMNRLQRRDRSQGVLRATPSQASNEDVADDHCRSRNCAHAPDRKLVDRHVSSGDRYAARETVLKHASLLKLVRYLSVIFSVSVCVTTTSFVHARMTCTNVAKFPAVSDPLIHEQLQAHAKTLPGLGSFRIGEISSRFFIVSSEDEKCKEASSCYYRLLDLRNGAVKDVFAFQGSGKILMILSPVALWSELLQDDYSEMEFETRENTYLTIKLPSLGNTVLVVPESPEEIKMVRRICGAHSK